MNLVKKISLLAAAGIMWISCNGPEVIHDLSEVSYDLVNQDSSAVNFPQDFKGNILVVGFIYTHCPDVCPIITAKLNNINNQLDDNSDVYFAGITFDPKRDSPSVLNNYMKKFNLDTSRFSMLTGNLETIDTLLKSINFKAEVADSSAGNHEHSSYIMNHTNRISVIDRQGRVRFEYPGSAASEKIVIEDINTLR